jgi:hypothetical protein
MTKYCIIRLDNIEGQSIDSSILTHCLDTITKETQDNDIIKTLGIWKNIIKTQKKYIMSWKLPFDLEDSKYDIIETSLWDMFINYYNAHIFKYMVIKKLI